MFTTETLKRLIRADAFRVICEIRVQIHSTSPERRSNPRVPVGHSRLSSKKKVPLAGLEPARGFHPSRF
jgi:hypothetical protein